MVQWLWPCTSVAQNLSALEEHMAPCWPAEHLALAFRTAWHVPVKDGANLNV